MVKERITNPAARPAEIALALRFAPRGKRAALSALFDLDDTLGRVLRTTREPLLGQMRLTWWSEALARLDTAPPAAEPVLQALAAEVLPLGVTGAMLATLIDGWEALLDPELSQDALARHARGRGGRVFELAAATLGADDPSIVGAGEGWAYADLASNLRDAKASRFAQQRAREVLASFRGRQWSRAARPLGVLALLAEMDVRGVVSGPRRAIRLARHRLTGR